MTSYRRINSRTINRDVREQDNMAVFMKPISNAIYPDYPKFSVPDASLNCLLVSTGSQYSATASSKLKFNGTTLDVYGNLDVSGNTDVSGDLHVLMDATIEGDLNVTGDADVSGDSHVAGKLHVVGNADVSGNVNVMLDANIFGDLYVTGNSDISGDSDIAGKLHVAGNADVSGNVNVLGNSNVTGNSEVSGKLHVAGNADVSGNVNVLGNSNVTGNSAITGNLQVSGNVLSYGTIRALQFLPGQVVNVAMLSYIDLGQGTSTTAGGGASRNLFAISYTPKISNSYLLIEYQSIYYLGGSNNDSLDAYLFVDYEETAYQISHTYQRWINGVGGGTRSGTMLPIVGRYTNTTVDAKTIRVRFVNSTDDDVIVNGDNSTWLKITEIGR